MNKYTIKLFDKNMVIFFSLIKGVFLTHPSKMKLYLFLFIVLIIYKHVLQKLISDIINLSSIGYLKADNSQFINKYLFYNK